MIKVEHGTGVPDTSLFERAWDECIELQMQSKSDWVANSVNYLDSITVDRLIAYDGDKIIGGLLLSEDDDVHVGSCMSVVFHYVLPEYASGYVGFKLFRLALSLTRHRGFPVLAYTHRAGPWTYLTKYRKT
jgi:hypothetical protein